MKIGILVKSTFARLIGNELIDPSEVERLQRVSDQRNVNGYPRYYTDLYTIHEKRYLLCNHWVEELSRSYFEVWLNQVGGTAADNLRQ